MQYSQQISLRVVADDESLHSRRHVIYFRSQYQRSKIKTVSLSDYFTEVKD